MEHRPVNPDTIAAPAANYAHARLSTDAGRWLHTSGVVPVRPDGSVPIDIGEQADVVWRNLATMIADAQMVPADVVSVTTYVVPGQDLAAVMAARDRALDGALAASTLVVVAELVRPEWKVEIAIIAAAG